MFKFVHRYTITANGVEDTVAEIKHQGNFNNLRQDIINDVESLLDFADKTQQIIITIEQLEVA